MRVFAQFLIVVSLVAAALAASVAYHVPLNLPPDDLIGLTLQDEPDLVWVEQDEPITEADRILTSERLELLRARQDPEDQRVPKVRVGEFSFQRWQGKWIFGGALIGLAAGALILRQRQDVERQTGSQPGASPAQRLSKVQSSTQQLLTQWEQSKDARADCAMATHRISEIQQHEVARFLESQDQLIAELGLGPAAEILDQFAAAERQLNRAWSAAADEDELEAIDCLRAASLGFSRLGV